MQCHGEYHTPTIALSEFVMHASPLESPQSQEHHLQVADWNIESARAVVSLLLK